VDECAHDVRFDLSRVASLQEDATMKYNRTINAYKAGLLQKNEARRALGYGDVVGGEAFFSAGAGIRSQIVIDPFLPSPPPIANTARSGVIAISVQRPTDGSVGWIECLTKPESESINSTAWSLVSKTMVF
jgi:hypothetical protein